MSSTVIIFVAVLVAFFIFKLIFKPIFKIIGLVVLALAVWWFLQGGGLF